MIEHPAYWLGFHEALVKHADWIPDRYTLPWGTIAGTAGGAMLGARLGGPEAKGQVMGGVLGGLAGRLLGTGADYVLEMGPEGRLVNGKRILDRKIKHLEHEGATGIEDAVKLRALESLREMRALRERMF